MSNNNEQDEKYLIKDFNSVSNDEIILDLECFSNQKFPDDAKEIIESQIKDICNTGYCMQQYFIGVQDDIRDLDILEEYYSSLDEDLKNKYYQDYHDRKLKLEGFIGMGQNHTRLNSNSFMLRVLGIVNPIRRIEFHQFHKVNHCYPYNLPSALSNGNGEFYTFTGIKEYLNKSSEELQAEGIELFDYDGENIALSNKSLNEERTRLEKLFGEGILKQSNQDEYTDLYPYIETGML